MEEAALYIINNSMKRGN